MYRVGPILILISLLHFALLSSLDTMVRKKSPRTALPADKKVVTITSINMQKSRVCWDFYKKVLAETKNPIVMAVQEVPKGLSCSALSVIRHSDKSRVCILASKALRVVAMPQFCSNDLAVCQWSNIGPKGRRTTIVASAYWPHEEEDCRRVGKSYSTTPVEKNATSSSWATRTPTPFFGGRRRPTRGVKRSRISSSKRTWKSSMRAPRPPGETDAAAASLT